MSDQTDPPPPSGKVATREEALRALHKLAGGWGSEEDGAVLSYIVSLEERLAAQTERVSEPTTMSWDWKSSPSIIQLESALNPLGVHVYSNPHFEGSDAFGFVLSNRPLAPEEVERAGNPEG